MSDSVQPQRRQPTRPPYPWDSPGKNTGVGCHFLLQCIKVKSESEVTQSCLTLHDPMDYSPPGSSVHGVFQARILEWDAIPFSDKWWPSSQMSPLKGVLITNSNVGEKVASHAGARYNKAAYYRSEHTQNTQLGVHSSTQFRQYVLETTQIPQAKGSVR